MFKTLSDLVNTALINALYLLGMKLISLPANKNINKALLVNRLQVQGGANLEDTVNHHFQANAESVPSLLLLTRRTAGDDYYKLMEPYFIARRNIPNYPKAFPCVNQL